MIGFPFGSLRERAFARLICSADGRVLSSASALHCSWQYHDASTCDRLPRRRRCSGAQRSHRSPSRCVSHFTQAGRRRNGCRVCSGARKQHRSNTESMEPQIGIRGRCGCYSLCFLGSWFVSMEPQIGIRGRVGDYLGDIEGLLLFQWSPR